MNVEPSSAHAGIEIPRWLMISGRLFMFSIGVTIAFVIYHECLHDPECNSIAVGFLSILSLAFFSSAGLPVEKLVNADIVKKG